MRLDGGRTYALPFSLRYSVRNGLAVGGQERRNGWGNLRRAIHGTLRGDELRINKDNPAETQSMLLCRGFTILQTSCHQDVRATYLPLRLRFVNEAPANVNVAVNIRLRTARQTKSASTFYSGEWAVNRPKKTCKSCPEPLLAPKNSRFYDSGNNKRKPHGSNQLGHRSNQFLHGLYALLKCGLLIRGERQFDDPLHSRRA
jgi:hypothetical protein